MRENAEGLGCGSPRRDHFDVYWRLRRDEIWFFEVEWRDKVIEVIDGDERALIGAG